MGAIDKGFTDIESIPWDEIDLVILSTPVKTFLTIAENIKRYLRKDTVVTDVGSVKGELVKKLEEILKPAVL